MTGQHIHLAIGVPIIVNVLFNGILAILLLRRFNARVDAMVKLFTEDLRHFEDVLDVRLSHIEEKLGIR